MYCKSGAHLTAMNLLELMKQDHIQPDTATYSALLPTCPDLITVQKVHTLITEDNIVLNPQLRNLLVQMYVKNDDLHTALMVFDQTKARIKPDLFTYGLLLSSCAKSANLARGKQIHQLLLEEENLPFTLPLYNTLISLYGRCGDVTTTFHLFEETKKHFTPNDVTFLHLLKACANFADLQGGKKVHQELQKFNIPMTKGLYNAVINMYCKCGEFPPALDLLKQMKGSGLSPDSTTYSTLLFNCTDLKAGELLHAEITENNLLLIQVVRNSLIHMYGQCGMLDKALKVFKDTKELVEPNSTTYTCLVTACAISRDLHQGKLLHEEIRNKSSIKLTSVLRNAIVNMYCKCEDLDSALQLYRETKDELLPNTATFVALLSACANMAMIETGKLIHEDFKSSGVSSSLILQTALINFYGNCGYIDIAASIFDALLHGNTPLNVVTWSAIIAANGRNGRPQEALRLFKQMQQQNILPNKITFLSVLSACSHGRFCEDALELFENMQSKYDVLPDVDHWTCMVDVMARVGNFEAAEGLLQKMDAPNSVTWLSLMGAARSYQDVGRAASYFQNAVRDTENPAAYVLLGNTYARAGRFSEASAVRKTMADKGLIKIPGVSCIEINYKQHCFRVGDRSHPHHKAIYAKLDELNTKLKQAGFKPDTSWVLQDIPESEKERVLCYHR